MNKQKKSIELKFGERMSGQTQFMKQKIEELLLNNEEVLLFTKDVELNKWFNNLKKEVKNK